VVLPQHLQTLARVADREVSLAVGGPVTTRAILDALEARFPQLRGTIRDHGAPFSGAGPTSRGTATAGSPMPGKRRPFVRFFACAEDWSHASPDDPLPAAVAAGQEPFLIVGAMAGG
jgi:molybdopterin synthase sulfur carrier subunit